MNSTSSTPGSPPAPRPEPAESATVAAMSLFGGKEIAALREQLEALRAEHAALRAEHEATRASRDDALRQTHELQSRLHHAEENTRISATRLERLSAGKRPAPTPPPTTSPDWDIVATADGDPVVRG